MADKLVNELTAATTPLLDADIALVSRDGIRLDRVSLLNLKNYVVPNPDQLKSTSAVLTNASNTAFVNITALEFPVVAGKSYWFDYIIRYQTAATTTGIALTIVAPTGTLTAESSMLQAADGTAARYSGAITTSGDTVTSTAVAAANTDTVARLSGVFVATANGTVTPQFRSSVNGSTVTVSIGSSGQISST